MIDFYGGGANVKPTAYYAAQPKHNVPKWPPTASASPTALAMDTSLSVSAPPPASDIAARARWLVYNSLWTSIGTVSVRLEGKPWGNVRSVADGVGSNSTGLPALYVPTPDPTHIDLNANPHATLSFSEAALAERVSPQGGLCGGMDPEDPTCARLHMYGTLRVLNKTEDLAKAAVDLCARHPLATWLCHGGAHTGGNYYTIDLTSLVFLDNYGGAAKLSVEDYLAAAPPVA